jgi:hypothetical protein
MSDAPIQNSALPPLNAPKQRFKISGIAYPGLGLSQYSIDDHVEFVLKGSVKGLDKPELGRGAVNLEFIIEEIKDITPRTDRDSTNRMV